MLEDGIYFLSKDGRYRKIDARDEVLEQRAQNPISADDLNFHCNIDTPMLPLDEIILVRDGSHIFHGAIWQAEDKISYWNVKCKSMQWFLGYRALSSVIYAPSTLNQILSSDAPSQSEDIPGILFRINSEIPNGKWIAHNSTVAKLVDGGLKSQMRDGTLYAYTTYPQGTADACDGVVQLSAAGAIPTAANTFYRTVDDLYIRLGDGSYRPNAFIVAALNKFDTKIRLGSIDIGSYKNTVNFAPSGQADSYLSDLCTNIGREAQFLPAIDGYIYLNLSHEISRGSTSSPVRTFVDGENATVTLTSDLEPTYQTVVGLPGDEAGTPQIVTNWRPERIQLFKLCDISTPTNADLRERIQLILDGQDRGLKVVAPTDWHLRVGDYVRAVHPDYGTYDLRVQSLKKTPSTMTAQIGKHVFSISDVFGEYLRAEIPDDAEALSETTITDPTSGSFTIKKKNVSAALVIYYEESYSTDADESSIDVGTFCDLKVNGKIVPPGRIILKSGGSVKMDITDYCNMSASADIANTISRNMYKATGWSGDNAKITQWKALKFLAA